MDAAIKHHFNQTIKERIQLTGGYTFSTWLLTLDDGQKVVFRFCRDFVTGGGRKIIISDILEREKFFYDSVNKALGHICPKVYVTDGSCLHHDTAFQISEYLEGEPLDKCFDSLNGQQKNNVYLKFGEIAGKINKMQIDVKHPFILSRGPWEDFFAIRLRERLTALIKNNLLTNDDINKIIDNFQGRKAERVLSFLHIDLRFANLIYNDGHIYLLDAENCEFGDPLYELSVLKMNNYLTKHFLEGYSKFFGEIPDMDNELFYFYQMERCALVADVFLNEVKDEALAKQYTELFNRLKSILL